MGHFCDKILILLDIDLVYILAFNWHLMGFTELFYYYSWNKCKRPVRFVVLYVIERDILLAGDRKKDMRTEINVFFF